MIRAVMALALLCTFLTADAFAQPDDLRARASEHIERGTKYQDLGEFAKAVEEYKLAYDLVPHPEILFNLGQAYRLNGSNQEALSYYEKYLAIDPNGRGAAQAQRYRDLLEKAGTTTDASTRGRRPEDVPNLVPQLAVKNENVVQNQNTVTVTPTQNQSTNVDVRVGHKETYEYKLKSSAAAFGLSMLVPGVGHLYYGENRTGVTYLGIYGASWGLAVVASVVHYKLDDSRSDALDIAAIGFFGLIGHGVVGLISGIHAGIGVSDYNDRVIEKYEQSKRVSFKGLNYYPLRTSSGATAHGAAFTWTF